MQDNGLRDARQKHADHEVAAGNPWYTDDQFLNQLTNPAGGHVVRGRWVVFEAAIKDWVSRTKLKGSVVRVLDLGCGDGINLLALRQICENLGLDFQLFGADYSTLRLRRAERLNVDGLFLGSVSNLPLSNESLDIILCNHVIEHVVDDTKALSEIYRVLTPEGLAMIGVPNEGCFVAQLRNNVIQPSIKRSTDHVQFYTAKTLLRKLNSAGFNLVTLRREGFFTPRLELNAWLQQRKTGRAVLRAGLRIWPSQAAGLICVLTRA